MSKFFVSFIVMSIGMLARSHSALSEDARQVPPGGQSSLAASRSRQSEEESSTPALAEPPPRTKGDEPLEPMLERAMNRYRSIVEEGRDLSWGTDTEAQLKRLEALLKTLKEKAARAAKPPTAPTKGSTPAAHGLPVIPVSAVLPAHSDPAGQTGTVAVLSPSKSTVVVPADVQPAPALALLYQILEAIYPKSITAGPSTQSATVPQPLPRENKRPIAIPAEDDSGKACGQEMAEQFQQLASNCERLSRELRDLAGNLRKRPPLENPASPASSTDRKAQP